jgi:hypothetical protein
LYHSNNPLSQTLLEVTDEETYNPPVHKIISLALKTCAEITDGDVFSNLAHARSETEYNDPLFS